LEGTQEELRSLKEELLQALKDLGIADQVKFTIDQ
jgi:hypothetical protein